MTLELEARIFQVLLVLFGFQPVLGFVEQLSRLLKHEIHMELNASINISTDALPCEFFLYLYSYYGYWNVKAFYFLFFPARNPTLNSMDVGILRSSVCSLLCLSRITSRRNTKKQQESHCFHLECILIKWFLYYLILFTNPFALGQVCLIPTEFLEIDREQE